MCNLKLWIFDRSTGNEGNDGIVVLSSKFHFTIMVIYEAVWLRMDAMKNQPEPESLYTILKIHLKTENH